jgi:predicted DsbA family dithiol-disulfide isomerase
MHIDIVADVICPWCFIGKRKLERALALRPDLGVSTTWRAFQLNPDMPPEGMAREAYLAAKFGGAPQASRIYAAVKQAGAAEDIPFAFDLIRRTPNSLDAHRLIRFATRLGRADALVEALFSAYFLEGRDVGDRATLAAVAEESGFDRAEARRFLDSDAAAAEIQAEDRAARRLGINAVPCFIVDNSYAISGAQDPEFFLPIFDLAQNAAPALRD